MSVLQVVTSTHRRGAETFAVDLGGALGALVHTVRTVALEAATGDATLDLAVVGGRRDGAAVRHLGTWAAAADVVVAHGSATLLATALATADPRRPRRARPPFVYRLIGDPTYWAPDLRRRLQVGGLLHRATAVVTYHAAAADELVRRYLLPSRRVHVIGKGIDPTPFPVTTPADRTGARDALGLDPRTPVIAWIGALSPEKDPLLAIDVARRVPGAVLAVAGDGPLRAEIAHAASDTALGGDRRILVLGALDRPRDLLAAADVLLVTSRTEGIPGVVLEAGLTGLPVVSVDVGGVGEVVDDGRTGRVVAGRDPGDLADAVGEAVRSRPTWGARAAAEVRAQADLGAVADSWATLLADVAGR